MSNDTPPVSASHCSGRRGGAGHIDFGILTGLCQQIRNPDLDSNRFLLALFFVLSSLFRILVVHAGLSLFVVKSQHYYGCVLMVGN